MKSIFLVLFSSFFFISALTIVAHGATYYSSPVGSGTTCSIAAPCSLNAGINRLSPGDTLYLREGNYRQAVKINKSGKEGSVITISGYAGENAVIDGYDKIPSHWGTLFDVLGNWVTVRDLEIKDSFSMGLVMRGDHNSAVNIFSHGNYENGILVSSSGSTVGSGKYALIDSCNVYYNCKEERLGLRSNWSSGVSLQHGASYGIIRNCKVWENAGEGLSVFCYNCSNPTDYALVENNIIFNNKSANLYLQNTRHTVVKRNIVYSTKTNWGERAGGIQIQNELSCNRNDDNKILNNFVMNANYHNLVRWYSTSAGGSFTNWVIAGNTFVNANGDSCIKLEAGGTPYNNLIANNIFIQEDSSAIADVPAGYATWSHNLWSKKTDPDAKSSDDIIGDPQITKGAWGAGTLTAEYFKIKNNSPARGAGIAISDLKDDFFGTVRAVDGKIDIGGFEYNDGPIVINIDPPAHLRILR